MTNTYRATSPQAEAAFASGVFEADYSVMEEKDHLDSGLIELVPRKYLVLSNNFSGGPQNGEYVGALRKETEAALIAGGHIQRVDAPVAAVVSQDEARANEGLPPVQDEPAPKKSK